MRPEAERLRAPRPEASLLLATHPEAVHSRATRPEAPRCRAKRPEAARFRATRIEASPGIRFGSSPLVLPLLPIDPSNFSRKAGGGTAITAVRVLSALFAVRRTALFGISRRARSRQCIRPLLRLPLIAGWMR